MFSDYGEKLEAVGGNLKRATEEALEKSKDYVNGELHKQMKKHLKDCLCKLQYQHPFPPLDYQGVYLLCRF